MNSLHAMVGNLVTAGTLYGWRIDAMLISGLLWAAMAAYGELRSTTAFRLAGARA